MSFDGQLDVVPTDAGVEFSFTVTNTGTRPTDVTFTSGQLADITVYRDDEEFWTWSDEKMFTQAMQTKTLAPDESLTHHAVWDDPAPGAYVAEASLEAVDATLVVRTAFEV